MKNFLSFFATIVGLSFFVFIPASAATIVDIQFPVDGPSEFIDDFGDARYQHSHEGNDIKAAKMTPVLAANSGRVTWAPIPEPSYGYMLWVDGDDGYKYSYIHLNNDTPGTDDGNGGPENAYGPGVRQGSRVTRGQVIGYVGDSGNAEGMQSHLHFEIRLADDTPINPYLSLLAAQGEVISTTPPAGATINYSPDAERNGVSSINENLGLTPSSSASNNCTSGSLIKSASTTSVYYCGANGKRYVFSNSGTFFSWYKDFSSVNTLSEEQLASIPLGGNVRYRPGVHMVKIQSDPKVYAIAKGGQLRWVTSGAIAEEIYGSNWSDNVHDLSETFFINYQLGDDIVWE